MIDSPKLSFSCFPKSVLRNACVAHCSGARHASATQLAHHHATELYKPYLGSPQTVVLVKNLQEKRYLHLKHRDLACIFVFKIVELPSGHHLDPGNTVHHGGHSCTQRWEWSAVFPRYQSVPPSTSAPEVISCPRAAALESDLSILPLPPSPPTPRLYNFIFSSSIFISRRVSFSIEFDLRYIRFSYRPTPPLNPPPQPKKRVHTGRVDRLQTCVYHIRVTGSYVI